MFHMWHTSDVPIRIHERHLQIISKFAKMRTSVRGERIMDNGKSRQGVTLRIHSFVCEFLCMWIPLYVNSVLCEFLYMWIPLCVNSFICEFHNMCIPVYVNSVEYEFALMWIPLCVNSFVCEFRCVWIALYVNSDTYINFYLSVSIYLSTDRLITIIRQDGRK